MPCGCGPGGPGGTPQLFFDLDIRKFGAVEGGADTSAAIIAAYTELVSADPYVKGRLIIPGGVWGMGQELQVDHPNVQIVGGNGSQLLKLGTNHHVLDLTNNATNCMVTGLEINGNSEPQGSLILCRGSWNTIAFNYLHDNGDISNPTPYANQSHGVCLDGQVSTCTFNHVFSNRIINNHDIGVSQNTAPDNLVESNRIIRHGLEGCTIDVTSHRARVLANRIEQSCVNGGVGGIGTDGSDLWTVAYNQIIATQNNLAGLKTQNNTGPCNYFAILGNLVLDNGVTGLWLFHNSGSGFTSSNGVVNANTVRGGSGSIEIDAGSNNNIVTSNSINGVAVVNSGSGNSLANNI